MNLDKLKFPIGPFILPEQISGEMKLDYMNQLILSQKTTKK